MKDLKTCILFLVTLIGFILGFVGLKSNVQAIAPIPEYVFNTLLYFSVFSIGLLIILAAAYLAISAFDGVKPSEISYNISSPTYEELPLLRKFIAACIDEDIATIQRMQQWYNKNPHMLKKIVRQSYSFKKKSETLVGFYSIYPLNAYGVEGLEQSLLQGTALDAKMHIANNSEETVALYIGAVGASNRWYAGQMLLLLRGAIEAMRSGKNLPIYTRPTTEAGLKLVLKTRSFEQIDKEAKPLGSIYRMKT